MGFIGKLDDFPDRSATGLAIHQLNLLVLRQGRKLLIYENRCPHTRESLDPMGGSVVSPDGLLIRCQRHAAVFIASTGECVGGPCLGENLTPVGFTLSNGDIYLD